MKRFQFKIFINQEIDWDSYKDQLETVGLVDKLKENYDSLQSQNYEVENVAIEASKNKSIERDAMDKELEYQWTVWAANYFAYRHVMMEVEDLANLWDYSRTHLLS